eukprot:gnl/TRDRNA2_/TRDRNA2_148044_c0_seq2.p1 gnl/TRDRNA2_/TRDRNA2_148044_c0~~gnl/TRDRNA2_/TRDRNA2_148044_c0_seq2.p1  ORF type:complete len:323 (+),score=35.84 gnl/TRDRNA2_/TRDRNA2_148044_c0_seq2:87-1055(+)
MFGACQSAEPPDEDLVEADSSEEDEDAPQLPETYVAPDRDGAEGLYFCEDSRFAAHLTAKSLALSSWGNWYRAPWWLRQGDLMTIFHRYIREEEHVEYQHHVLATLDGGKLDLDLALRAADVEAPRPGPGVPLAILIPGGDGDSEETKVKNMVAALIKQGLAIAVLNMRGCGATPVQTPRFFSMGRGATDDLRMGVRYARETLCGGAAKHGDKCNVFLLGWCIGASIVGNALAEQSTGEGQGHGGRWTAVDGGVALGTPFDLHRAMSGIEDNPVRRHIFNRALTQQVVELAASGEELFRRGPVTSTWIPFCQHRRCGSSMRH